MKASAFNKKNNSIVILNNKDNNKSNNKKANKENIQHYSTKILTNSIDINANKQSNSLLELNEQLYNKLYYLFNSEVKTTFLNKIDENIKYYFTACKLVESINQFKMHFSNIIESNFDLDNPDFKIYWNKIKPLLHNKLKELFFVKLKDDAYLDYNYKSKTNYNSNIYKLLQWNDYINYIDNNDEKVKYNILKSKMQKKQKEMLDTQIINNLIINNCNYKSSSDVKNKLKLKNLVDKTLNDINKNFIIKSNLTPSLKLDYLLRTSSDIYNNELAEEITKEEERNFYNINYKNTKDVKNRTKKHYIKIINNMDNYFTVENNNYNFDKDNENKDDNIDKKLFKKNEIKVLDKRTLYNLRNSSNIFFS